MANIYSVVFVWFSLFTVCYSLTVTGSRDDEGEYEDFADIESSTEKKCFFKVSLINCKKGKVLKTFIVDEDKDNTAAKTAKKNKKFSTTVGVSTSEVCLTGLCIYHNSKEDPTAVSKAIDLEGSGETAEPSLIKKGYSKHLYRSSRECMREGKAISTIKCFKMKVPTKSGKIEEYEPMEMQEEDNDEGISDEDAMKNGFMQDEEEGDSTDDDQTAKQQNNDDNVPSGADEQEVDVDQLKANLQEGTTANIQWTRYRGTIYINCGNRNGIYSARSRHQRYYKDRSWYFSCKRVSNYNFNHCYWTGYLNNYDGALSARCGCYHIMTGIYSIYHNYYGDRKFQFLCCRAPYYRTRQCSTSGFVNWFRSYISYRVGGNRVFTGAYSYHSNYHEDRRWRFTSCSYSC